MKINIQGNVIDTKYIYRIGEIVTKNHGYWNVYFTIYFINKKQYDVVLSVPINSTPSLACQFYEEPDFDKYKFEYFSMDKLLNHKIYTNKLNSMIKLRNDLINIWNENKSDILELKFE